MGNNAPKPGSSARPAVVNLPDQLGSNDTSSGMGRLMTAVVLSIFINCLLIFMFYFVSVSGAETPSTETAVFETQVDEETKGPNLENDEIGLDPDVPTNYNVTRLEDVSVPGAVKADEQVGIDSAPPGPPMTLPPPPGMGGNFGTGGGVDDPTRVGTASLGMAGGLGGKVIPGGFAGRSGATRMQMVQEGGGNAASEAAVASGLKFMAQHQFPDGHWSLDKLSQGGKCNCTGAGSHNNDVAATAFGLLPLLGAGQTHKTGSDKGNLYTKEVDRGLRYLILKQNAQGELHSNMYAHGLASIAVCEAYGLTSDPALRGPAQRCLNYIVEAQSRQGGWRYSSCHRGDGGYDGSICAWQLMALKSGQMAGLDVPNQTLNLAKTWLDAAQTQDGAAYGYCSPGGGPATSAAGLLCRQYLGWGPRTPALRAGVDNLHKIGPQANYMYYSYYATQVMHHMGGSDWDKWNPKMRDGLIAAQDKGATNPHQKGSWYDPRDSLSSGAGGRMMQTCLSLVSLEVYYRHMPLYRRDYDMNKDVAKQNK